MDGLSLDQLTVFVTVVDEGSFSAAARRLNRTQSAITYAIHKLEEQGGVPLFDRSAYRPTLTSSGNTLLPIARAIVRGVSRYRAQAADITQGLESEVRLIVDMLAPLDDIQAALRDFGQAYPRVSVRMAIEFHNGVEEQIAAGRADVAILATLAAKALGLESNAYCDVEFVPVASPTHPLANAPAPLRAEALEAHTQLVVSSRNSSNDAREYGVQALNRWYLSDLWAKRALLIAGLGWGSMPLHSVREDLANGGLVRLNIARWEGADQMPVLQLACAYRAESQPGVATRWLLNRLSQNHANT